MALSRVNSKMVGAGDVSNAEHAYLNSISSNVQTQITGNNLPAVGSSGNVLTSDGTNWASTAPAGGGSWNVINTAVASNSSDLTVTGITTTYDTHAIVLSNIRGASGSNPRFRMGDSSGIDSGSSDYWYYTSFSRFGSTGYYAHDNSGSHRDFIDLCSAHNIGSEGAGGNSGSNFSGVLYISNGGDGTAGYYPTVYGHGASNVGTGNYVGRWQVAGARRASITLDRINFSMGSGNVAKGRITVYGINNS